MGARDLSLWRLRCVVWLFGGRGPCALLWSAKVYRVLSVGIELDGDDGSVFD